MKEIKARANDCKKEYYSAFNSGVLGRIEAEKVKNKYYSLKHEYDSLRRILERDRNGKE